MPYDVEFTDGFDKYGPTGRVLTIEDLGGEWTDAVFTGLGSLTLSIVDSLAGPGQALKVEHRSNTNISTTASRVFKTLPGDYPRILGGLTLAAELVPDENWGFGVAFGDGDDYQVSIAVNTIGRLVVRSGDTVAGDLLGTTTASVSALSEHCLEFDVIFHASAGEVRLWLDNALVLELTGVNTAPSGNAWANTFGPRCNAPPVGGANTARYLILDSLYLWLYESAAGDPEPALSNPIVETQFPIDDHAVDFSFGAGVLGPAEPLTTTTSAPGANRLTLRRFTPDVDCDLDSIGVLPAATNGVAKFKGVAYSDTAGAPDALLSSGTEVVACVAGEILELPLVTPQALTAGDPVWIGYITDTAIAIAQHDLEQLGYGAANTYGSGAPNPAPAMTSNLASWLIWGNVSGVAVNWPQVDENPALGNLSFNASSTVNHEDLFVFPALSTTPTTIYTVAVKANAWRDGGGARTMDLRHKSGAVTGSGETPGQTLAASPGWITSYFRTDPDTGAAFNASGLNAGFSGYKIAS